jgi:hypothetical protein
MVTEKITINQQAFALKMAEQVRHIEVVGS